MRIQLLAFASTVMISSHMHAQNYEFDVLDINNTAVVIESNGDMHTDSAGLFTTSMPSGSNKTAITKQCLWMGGYDENAELRLAANTYRQSGEDYWPGPIADSYNTAYDNTYDKVWRMKKSVIENHIDNYNTPGYGVPTMIADWPANGNTANGEAQNLAPYVDLNSNNIYEPELGDYPLIRGDEALYVIFNDDKGFHTETGGQKIKVEIHHMLYAYYTNGEEFNDNTVYSHYEIYNRSDLNFSDFYVTNFLDIDLGDFLDDYIGTEVSKNLIYGYNSTNIDSSSIPNYPYNYGTNPPAYGYVLLNQDLAHSMAYQNNFDPMNGNPQIAPHFYNYMRAKWKPGNSLTHPVDGTTANHLYPDFPDTTNISTWSDINYSVPHDRRILGTMYVQDFGPGDKICMDNAGIFAHDESLTHLEQITHLFNLTDQVQSFYDAQYDNCEDVSDLSIYEAIHLGNQNLTMYQNQNTITLSLEQSIESDIQIRVVDALGRQVVQTVLQQGELSLDLNLDKTSPGTYFIQCSNQNFNQSIPVITI